MASTPTALASDTTSDDATSEPLAFPLETLPPELLQRIFRAVRGSGNIPPHLLVLSKSLYPVVFSVFYEQVVLVDRAYETFCTLHRDDSSKAPLLSCIKSFAIRGTCNWGLGCLPEDEIRWLLRRIQPEVLDLEMFGDEEGYWTNDDELAMLHTAVQHMAPHTLRLCHTESFYISSAIELVRACSKGLKKLIITRTPGDEEHEDEDFGPAERTEELSEATSDLSFLRSLVHFSTDSHGLHSLARLDGWYRPFLSNSALSNLASLTLSFDIMDEDHRDTRDAGATYLFDQHGHKLRELKLEASARRDCPAIIPLRPDSLSNMSNLRSLKSSTIYFLDMTKLPRTLEQLVIGNCNRADLAALDRLANSESMPSKLRRIEMTCPCRANHLEEIRYYYTAFYEDQRDGGEVDYEGDATGNFYRRLGEMEKKRSEEPHAALKQSFLDRGVDLCVEQVSELPESIDN